MLQFCGLLCVGQWIEIHCSKLQIDIDAARAEEASRDGAEERAYESSIDRAD